MKAAFFTTCLVSLIVLFSSHCSEFVAISIDKDEVLLHAKALIVLSGTVSSCFTRISSTKH